MKSDYKKTLLSVLLITILGFAVYANSLNNEFIWDDNILVKHNPYIRDWSNVPKIFTENIGAGSGREFRYYRPLHIFTYMIDYSLWGLNVVGYHLISVILHILVALCIYWLVTILYDDRLLSLFTGILFVVHPIHVETVASISIRGDLLSALFMLLCFIFYINPVYRQKKGFYYILIVSSYILALLSKENSLVLPALLLLYHYISRKKINVKAFMSILLIACAYIILRFTMLGSTLISTSWIPTVLARVPGFFVAITNYIRLMLMPFGLHMEYGYKLFSPIDPRAILGAAMLFSLLIYSFKKRKTNGLIFFSVGWFFIALLPVSNIYPLAFYMAEHWLYLPSLGFFLILAKGLSSLYRKREFRAVTIVFLIGLLAFYSYLTVRQNNYWKEPIAFYKKTLHYTPDSARTHYNLALAYYHRDEEEKAITSYKKAIEIKPDYADAYHNLGVTYYHIGNKKEAIAAFKKTIEIDPNYPKIYSKLADPYYDIGRKEEAIASYKKAIEIDPGDAGPYNSLGIAYYDMGMKEEAMRMFKKAIEADPRYTKAYNNLANIYRDAGKKEEAIALYEEAIKNDPEYAEAYNNLGIAHRGLGKDEEAILLFKKAIEINPDYTKAYNNLANAYYDIGRKKEAIGSYKKAIQIDPDNAVAHNNLALVYYLEKQYDLAIEHYDRAIALGYNVDPGVLRALEPYRK